MAQTPPVEPKLVLVTMDGVRWQEIFRGADPVIAADARFVEPDLNADVVKPVYLDPTDRPAALAPFLHGVVARDGVLYGNDDIGQCAHVANDMWFSYPGYNEILTGKADARIVENDDIPNANVTFLEYLNRRQDFRDKVTMVGTWTLFPNIVNASRSGIPVNAAFAGRYPTDVLTARYGLQAIRDHMRVVYIAFGDTDELAHAGDYDQYLQAIERGDDYLRQLWETLQADPFYRGQTTLLVTTDHGRGDLATGAWRDHSAVRYHQLNPTYQPEYNETGVTGSDKVWFAAIGPSIDPAGETGLAAGGCAQTHQLAATALTALGLDWQDFASDIGKPFPVFSKP
ncbi:alkaline phosphatase family protein [Asticcacaulis sp. AC402]|uniref:alkaline phosphatase family protein n=1 Tax=Asticcacaulis sp. AC402 TaxID=1282361 RepID=UPI00138AD062|nr:alkaline phosphatase family protein [Asticcacaulis sp. AC402]